VRRPGVPQVFEALPALHPGRTPLDWIDRSLPEIAAARVREVDVAARGRPSWRALRTAPAPAHLTLPDLPPGRELASAAAADTLASILEHVAFDELRHVPADHPRAPEATVTVHTFDGLVVTIDGVRDPATPATATAPSAPSAGGWIRLSAHVEPTGASAPPPMTPKAGSPPPDPEQEAARLNARAQGVEYRVPSYLMDSLFPNRDDYLRPRP
jgi:hypothetical protein